MEPLSFYQNVSPSKELRDASNDAEILVRDFGVESSMRLDVFQAKTNALKNIKESGEWDKLSPEEQRLADKMVLDGTRAGLALPEKERAELTELKKELSQVCLEFSKNFNEENGVVSFTLEELKGVPEDVISGFPKRGDKYDVTHKTPDIFPVVCNLFHFLLPNNFVLTLILFLDSSNSHKIQTRVNMHTSPTKLV